MTRFASSNSPLLILALLLSQLFWDGAAQAQNASKFRQHYEAALREYDAGQYESALQDFQAAYAIKQLPRLLLNIGQIHRKLGHAKDALGYYELYLRVEPNPKPEIKEELQAYITQTRTLLAAAERMKARQENPGSEEEPPPAEKTPTKAAPVEPAPSTIATPPPSNPLAATTPKATDSPRPIYKKWSYKKFLAATG